MIDCNGAIIVCGAHQPNDRPKTELRVLKETFWVRMLLFADMVREISQSKAREACDQGIELMCKLREVRNLGLCGKFHVR